MDIGEILRARYKELTELQNSDVDIVMIRMIL